MVQTGLERLQAISNAYANGFPLISVGGRIVAISSDCFVVSGLQSEVALGAEISVKNGSGETKGVVIRIDNEACIVAAFGETSTLKIGDRAVASQCSLAQPSESWLGRVLNSIGEPVDGKRLPKFTSTAARAATRNTIPALSRSRVNKHLHTGVKAIDIFTPLCFGQRLGIFAGSGVGKTTLLSMLAKSDAFDIVVIALVGERGREVREFLEDTLGSNALGKCVAIVSTSDDSALMRKTAPQLAMRTAEYFRDCGKNVLLLLDSITRYAHALRELGSNAGEPPVARGFPASVFSELPKLLERVGPGLEGSGSITAIITVLVEGDDHNEPIADAVRGILDGHIVLTRSISEQGRFPAIDLLASLSRLAPRVWTMEQRRLVLQLKKLISRFEETKDLRMLGTWRPGEDEDLDTAVATVPQIYAGLVQSPDMPPSIDAFADLLEHLRHAQGSRSHAG